LPSRWDIVGEITANEAEERPVAEELFFMSAAELARRIADRELSAGEVVDAFLRRIDDLNHETNSFTTVTHELAVEAARRCDEAATRGISLGPLHGVPVGIKDLFDFRAGVRNTFGSVPLKDFVPRHTTPYIQRLEDAGAVIVGKTNAPEFGHKGITDNYVTGATSTPFDLTRNSGGSSGGSAAAVAAGLVPLAQGTDGGGSIRIPSAWCGVFGYKPSFGRIADVARPDSAAATSPFISTGPIARSIDDAALMLSVMAGPHPRDPYSLPALGADWSVNGSAGLAGKRVAFSSNLSGFPVDPEIAAIVTDATTHVEVAGASVDQVEISWPADQFELSELWLRITGLMYLSAFEAIKGWGVDLIDDHSGVLTPALLDMILAAQELTRKEVLRDRILRSAVQDAVQDVFDDYDFIISPTLAVSPVKNAPDGQTAGPTEVNGTAVDPSIGWCLTYPFNFTGNPAASIPCGLTATGLPIGMQIVGRQHADLELLAACAAFESAAPWLHTYRR
jgi:amidase/aspartyl-tRNA(Asn)/glutamyl-tRNA(Gln) amidotransferase subunit A